MLNTNVTKTLAVVIGRFQTDTLSDGHRLLLDTALAKSTRLLILVGVRSSPATATNPLPFESVVQMLHRSYPTAMVLSFKDQPHNAPWMADLDHLIDMVRLPGEAVMLHGGRDSLNVWYTGKHPYITHEFGCDEISATKRRNEVGMSVENSSRWRRGVIWAMQNLFHRTFHTVDCAILRVVDGRVEILLGQKHDDDGRWRFPGGFVEKGEKFVVASGREGREETGIIPDKYSIIDDFFMNDWRVAGQKNVDHKTVLCGAWMQTDEVPKAADDLTDVQWFDLESVMMNHPNCIVPSHRYEMFLAVVYWVLMQRPTGVDLTSLGVTANTRRN